MVVVLTTCEGEQTCVDGGVCRERGWKACVCVWAGRERAAVVQASWSCAACSTRARPLLKCCRIFWEAPSLFPFFFGWSDGWFSNSGWSCLPKRVHHHTELAAAAAAAPRPTLHRGPRTEALLPYRKKKVGNCPHGEADKGSLRVDGSRLVSRSRLPFLQGRRNSVAGVKLATWP